MHIFKKNISILLSITAICMNLLIWSYVNDIHEQVEIQILNNSNDLKTEEIAMVEVDNDKEEVTNIEHALEETLHNDVELEKISQDELELLSLLTMAEAEGESEEGQRLVISTVLNRVDSEHFPNSISEVILQKNQFTSMWNGRVERCEVREDISNLVLDELDNRSDYDVIFFNSNNYSAYGKPLYKEGNHYFSSYN